MRSMAHGERGTIDELVATIATWLTGAHASKRGCTNGCGAGIVWMETMGETLGAGLGGGRGSDG